MQGGPYHDLLHSVLGAYTCYRPDIGYVSDHISSSSSLWQQLKLPSNKRSAFVLLLGSRHVLHRCRPHSQSRGGRGLHHLCQPAQQTLSDGILQSRPRTGEDLPPLSLYPPSPLLCPSSSSSWLIFFINFSCHFPQLVAPPPYCHLFLTFSSPPPSDAEVFWSLWGFLPGESSSALQSLPEQQLNAWSLSDWLVSDQPLWSVLV